MQRLATSFQGSTLSPFESCRIETTLYDLVKVVNEEVAFEEKQWVPLIVHQILENRRVIK